MILFPFENCCLTMSSAFNDNDRKPDILDIRKIPFDCKFTLISARIITPGLISLGKLHRNSADGVLALVLSNTKVHY